MSMETRRWNAIALFTVACTSGVLARPLPSWPGSVQPIESGQRVRVKVLAVKSHFYGERLQHSGWIIGNVVSVDDSTIKLRLADTSDSLSIRRESVARLERSVGFGTRRGEGFWIGLAVGVAAGVGAVASMNNNSAGDWDEAFDHMFYVIVAFGSLAVGGAAAGYFAGNLVKVEEWEPSWEHHATLSLGARVFKRSASVGAVVVLRF